MVNFIVILSFQQQHPNKTLQITPMNEFIFFFCITGELY